ncbi:MAG: hypothetical protein Q7Q71_15575 [Verrucomicrobiota bacterium JB023]|nr:hypothetical protein [Verrucomicrobiota bacterium JB023]
MSYRVLFVLLLSLSCTFGEPASQKAFDSLTEEQLLALQAKRKAAYEDFKPLEEKSGRRHPSQASLTERSVIISDGRSWTLVPKGAIIHLPESLKNRVNAAKSGQLRKFPDFFRINRGWVAVHEVTMEQAIGEKAISQEVMDSFKYQDRIVIATRSFCPITVLKPEVNATE